MDERRHLTDPGEIRALAHPVRQRIMRVLWSLRSATATEIADAVGESPANCSWHLRQLAKHGFVEETGEGRGRRRPWRPASRSLRWGGSTESGGAAAASDELSAVVMEEEFEGLRAWNTWRRTDPPEWQDVADFSQALAWLTVEELAEVQAEFVAIMTRYRDRERPPGARPIRMFAWAVPAEPMPADSKPAEPMS
ncbi:winged helix-turn-helix domain-containing protein [Actinomadura fibrosa]|uniref:Winged helix-turn-helix domain-containing protein n=1 Tax=Actinomadura fibrosa TaxID=111802 RepID=A0ABW2XNQ3_9ACTN|nr:helix-turn-helix domain-containing protein [Actinomadura fibrosa]